MFAKMKGWQPKRKDFTSLLTSLFSITRQRVSPSAILGEKGSTHDSKMPTVIALFEARMWKGVRPLAFRIVRAFGHFLMKSSSPASYTGVEVGIGVRG
jgi:hypothetical protein